MTKVKTKRRKTQKLTKRQNQLSLSVLDVLIFMEDTGSLAENASIGLTEFDCKGVSSLLVVNVGSRFLVLIKLL